MQFGLFYQQQMPKPWDDGVEVQHFANNLEQAVLADQLGFHSLWVTEHHFLEEYSHSSAPEIFLGAVAARTKKIRIGHGIRHTPPAINPPARVAEGISTLDVISKGRVEFGIGEGATRLELGAHYIGAKDKRAMCLEAGEQIANMLAMTPYPGWDGQYFKMECRNIVPKPVQKPHPPMWLACTNRDTIMLAARLGIGALAFSFVDPYESKQWVDAYYDIIKSDECVPIGHRVNARVAMVSPLSVNQDRATAIRDGYHCFNFFKYSLGATMRDSKPGHNNLWADYMVAEQGDTKRDLAAAEGVAQGDEYSGASGTPADVIKRMRIFEEAGVDDILFTIQGGGRPHEVVCDTLTSFAKDVMPAFASNRRADREAELAPYIEAALARKQWMPALSEDEVPIVPGVRNLSATVSQL
ncbi:LLM class flavin-dependent oxidoreductase [Sphingomonas sp. AOB5]|uniref:LLM class flavin-dependent oxidoreductase n=1 Tax=Sphingomonas sp. AOB5 TaxID=3034017 RepID=UPI0023F93EE8|nr:LLM class flavin-dependent oxidoreductase [Sphingomonas sp. AOB5]MDF7774845.1 LLM class flavin-dependent oxidoreductase [Sphingomonas sp. AOB5]